MSMISARKPTLMWKVLVAFTGVQLALAGAADRASAQPAPPPSTARPARAAPSWWDESPSDAPPARGPTKTHSAKLQVGGGVLIAFGIVSIIASVPFFVEATERDCDLCPFAYVAALPLLVHALGCIGGGVPMVVIGRRQIPVPSVTALVLKPTRPMLPRDARLPAGVAATWRF